MPFKVEWLVDKRVILTTINGEIDLDLVDNVTRTIAQFFDEGQLPLVHLIIDALDVSRFSANLLNTTKLTDRYMKHPLFGWGIAITANPMIKFIGAIATGVTKTRYRTFGSREEAFTFLAEMDNTVRDALLASWRISQPHG